MFRLRFAAGCLGLAFAALSSSPVLAQKNAPVPADARTMTIAVADFTGSDKELGRFVADSVLTDLAQSLSLSLVERTEIRQAFTELKLQSTGLTEPKQIKQLGKLISADRLIVGSFLLRDDTIFVNARLLDVRTGRLAAGGAASVSGQKSDLLSISHRLARLFHKRLTGTELRLDEEQDIRTVPRADIASIEDSHPEPTVQMRRAVSDSLSAFREQGLIPASAAPNKPVTERELAVLLNHVMRSLSRQTDNPLAIAQPSLPVSRLRALTALVKIVVRPGLIASFREAMPDVLPPDMNAVASWGKPYVAAAVEQGMWNAEQELRPREQATWAFVTAILGQMGILDHADNSNDTPKRRIVEREPDSDSYTGLIVDASDLNLKRCMSPRILDENGRILYPDQRHLPDYDYLLDNGMASYCVSAPNANRAGNRPLVIRAIDVTGSLDGDLVVSTQAARKILAANERGRFLSRWAVCFLIGQDR